MIHRDPLDSLVSNYANEITCVAKDDMFANILNARRKRKRTIIATTCSFALTGIAAVLMLDMASRPLQAPNHATSTAIARYQMIKSGLVERSDQGGEVAR